MADKLREHLSPNFKDIMIYDADYRSHAKDVPTCKPLDTALATLSQISTTLETYYSLSKAAPIKRPDWMEWSQDHKSLVSLNEHALRIAARQINCMVIPGKKMDEMPEEVNDVEKLAWEIFEETRPEDLENTWGEIAKGQIKVFLGLLETAVAG